jgi:hypothetical protein
VLVLSNSVIVVLTWDNPAMAIGIDRVEALVQVISRDLNPGAAEVIPPTAPQGSRGTPDEQVTTPPARC